MKFFLDTANIDEIKKFASWGVISGVTTNPTLIAKEGVNFEKRIKEITKVVDGPISVEVISNNLDGMIKEGRKYATWHRNIHVKVPCTPDGLKTIKTFKKEKIKTNATLVFSAGQAMLASKAGANLVSPFVGRLDDMSENGIDLIEEIINIFDNYAFQTEVVVASIRNSQHITDSAQMGAHIATIPPHILEKLIHHPLTDAGLKKFADDWKKAEKKIKK